jgi:hypothetical protein
MHSKNYQQLYGVHFFLLQCKKQRYCPRHASGRQLSPLPGHILYSGHKKILQLDQTSAAGFFNRAVAP